MKRLFSAICLILAFTTSAFALPDFVELPEQAVYRANMGHAEVVLGGQLPNDKFVPSVKGTKWGEAWVELFAHNVNVGNAKPVKSNGKVSLTVGNETHRFYPVTDESLEYEVEFATRPSSDTVQFRINTSPGVSAYHQFITPEQAAMGASYTRPDVEGSYAFYYNKKNGKYKTGKVAHLYRMKLIDNNGVESWCDMDLQGNALTVTMDGAFLDTAAYPVILDPLLGYDSKGASEFTIADYMHSWAYQSDSTGGEIHNFHVYAAQGGSTALKLAVLNINQSTTNPAGLSVVTQVEFTPADGVESTTSASGTLAANTLYGVAVSMQTGVGVYYDTGKPDPTLYYKSSSYAGNFADPSLGSWLTSEAFGYLMSMWVSYGDMSTTPIRTKLGYRTMIEDGF